MARFLGVSSSCGRDRLHPDSLRAQFDIQKACQVDKSGLAHPVGRHAARWLEPRAGGHVHDGT